MRLSETERVELIGMQNEPRRLSLDPSPGVHLIYGPSGSGKSELSRILAGLSSTSSRFSVEGLPLMRSFLVSQHPDDQIVAPTVRRELAFDRENRGCSSGRPGGAAIRLLAELGIEADGDREVATLSGGERQVLNIAVAVTSGVGRIILDDCLGCLSNVRKAAVVEGLAEAAREQGVVTIWLTSDRRDLQWGQSVCELDVSEAEYPRVDGAKTIDRNDGGGAFVEFDELSFRYAGAPWIFDTVNIRVGPFRRLGIVGDNGAGKSTLGWLLSGRLSAGCGQIRAVDNAGRPISIGYFPQFGIRSVGGFTLSELSARFEATGLIPMGSGEELLTECGWNRNGSRNLRAEDVDLWHSRQYLIRLMARSSHGLVILDEPFEGLGSHQKRALAHDIADRFSRKALAIIMHEPPDSGLAFDRTIEVSRGKILEW